jgi:uncharacterized membrane protein YoaK (UPF0700 family)
VLPFVLSVIAGSTDIIRFLGLNGLFTAHITGNIVVLAAHIAMSEAELHVLRARPYGGHRKKAAKGELWRGLPVGFV